MPEATDVAVELLITGRLHHGSDSHYRHLKTVNDPTTQELAKYGLDEGQQKVVSSILVFDISVSPNQTNYILEPEGFMSRIQFERLLESHLPNKPRRVFLSVEISGCEIDLSKRHFFLDLDQAGEFIYEESSDVVLKSLVIHDTARLDAFNRFPFSIDMSVFRDLSDLRIHFADQFTIRSSLSVFYPLERDYYQSFFPSLSHLSVSASDIAAESLKKHFEMIHGVFKWVQRLTLDEHGLDAFLHLPQLSRTVMYMELNRCRIRSLDQADYQGVMMAVKLIKPRATLALQEWAEGTTMAKYMATNDRQLFQYLQREWTDNCGPRLDLELD